MSQPPKYSLPEIERRWLVDKSQLPDLTGLLITHILDLYIDNTRMRLRKMTAEDGTITYKLCKKYGNTGVYSEPITNIYLTKEEYETFQHLIGRWVEKNRYRLPQGGSLDIPVDENQIVFEIEFASVEEAIRYEPDFPVLKEIL
ncbi:MAG: hypothetical protein KDC26_12235 [Armatimonadetes bacterium]|nr:hypothetical protein [Armatimonadota bacterium]